MFSRESCDNLGIGERIALLRSQLNMNQAQLAKELGISRQAVSKWENNLSSPDVKNLIQMAELFDVTIEFLAYGKETEPPKEPEPKTEFIFIRVKDPQTPPIPAVEPALPLVSPAVKKRKRRTPPLFPAVKKAAWITLALSFLYLILAVLFQGITAVVFWTLCIYSLLQFTALFAFYIFYDKNQAV